MLVSEEGHDVALHLHEVPSGCVLQDIPNGCKMELRDIHSDRKDGGACHVVGHTHFCWDFVVDEISTDVSISNIKMHYDYSNPNYIKFI